MFKPKIITTTLNEQIHGHGTLTMEECMSTKSLILHGCELTKELESSLSGNKASHVEDVASHCDRIANAFGTASERLRSRGNRCSVQELPAPQPMVMDSSLHEWLVTGFAKGMDVIQPEAVSMPENSRAGQLAWARSNTSSSSSSQRRRRRREGSETQIVKMAAPQIGNTELPPDDGYTWRKYGQKEIMGKKYPRAYYRCTHQRQFNCPAKKQVQRDDLEPQTFEVMYRGNHTCHLSATAPSMFPSQSVIVPHEIWPMVASSATLGSWLSMEFSTNKGTVAGPSRSDNKGLSVPEFPVVDMADVMFNSGSSITSNSMDFLFPSAEEHKRDIGINKN